MIKRMKTQIFLQRFVVMLIAIMPILSPLFVEYGWVSVQAEHMKTVWGVVGVFVAITLFIFIKINKESVGLVKNKFLMPMWLFIIWCFITILWVEDGYLAAIMLAQFVSFVLIFTLMVNLFINTNISKYLSISLMISMIFVSIVGLLQYYFPDNWNLQHVFMQTASPGSTFVNKNMASHFMVMVLPFPLILLLSTKLKMRVVFYSVALIIGSWFVLNTNARQAYLAIFLEIMLFMIFIFLDVYKNNVNSFFKKINLQAFKGVSLILVLLSLLILSNLTPEGFNLEKSSKLKKIQTISLADGSARIPAWRNTIETIIENPILGVGIGQWPSKYPLYYDRVMQDALFNEQARLKRLHNDYLEIFANVGVIGFSMLLWLVYVTINSIWKILKDVKNKNRVYTLGFTMGLLGFSVVAMFSFPVRVYLPAFFVFVYLAVIFINSTNHYKYYPIIINQNRKNAKIYFLISLMMTVYIATFSYKWFLSEYHFNNASVLHKAEMNKPAFSAAIKSLEYNNWSPKNYGKVAEILISLDHKEEAIVYLKKLIDISPFNTNALLMLSTIYELNDKDMERSVLEFILSFDPKNVQALSFLVKNLSSSDRGGDAAIIYKRLKNSFEYFKNRDNFGPYHQLVGYVATSVADYKYAKYIYTEAVERYPTAENYYNLATLEYDHLRNYKKGIFYAKKALEIDPNMNKNKEVRSLIELHEVGTKSNL
jgi:O-antigen ligase